MKKAIDYAEKALRNIKKVIMRKQLGFLQRRLNLTLIVHFHILVEDTLNLQ